MCLPCSIALMACSDAGLRDAGRLDDHLDAGMRRSVPRASADTWVRRSFSASSSEVAAYCSSGQPAVASWLRARSTLRSATPTICRPRVRRACDEEHGAELAGANQADGDRLAGGFAFEQQRARFIAQSYDTTPQRASRNDGGELAGNKTYPRSKIRIYHPAPCSIEGAVDRGVRRRSRVRCPTMASRWSAGRRRALAQRARAPRDPHPLKYLGPGILARNTGLASR